MNHSVIFSEIKYDGDWQQSHELHPICIIIRVNDLSKDKIPEWVHEKVIETLIPESNVSSQYIVRKSLLNRDLQRWQYLLLYWNPIYFMKTFEAFYKPSIRGHHLYSLHVVSSSKVISSWLITENYHLKTSNG